jgi:simple sugar transport system ATP-binding protein
MQVEFHQINKHFGAVHANKNITLTIPAGCIQGILGENGAGKSTLMKILSGFILADSGEIRLDGRLVHITTPAQAIDMGIGMLHQDPLDFPAMQVIDNLIIGQKRRLFPSRREAAEALQKIQSRFNFTLEADAYLDSLTVGERQQLELIRLLWRGARVLILDEPTTGISAPQKKKLFEALRQLAAEGKTIIFVTHKLDEVHEICDRAAVLRAGELVAEMYPPYQNEQFIAHMFGRVVTLPPRETCQTDEIALELRHLVVEDDRLRVGPFDLTVHAGEVIGLAGMEGSGQDLFLRACAGLVRPVDGQIIFHQKHQLLGAPYHDFLQHRIKYLPADRMAEGLIEGLTLTEHFALTQDTPAFFVDYAGAKQIAQQRIQHLNIRGTPDTQVQALSGGNQQRTLIAMLASPLSIVLLEHPTRGLDIESTIWIWSQLKDHARREKTALIFISSDLEEIMHYSDRILVFFAGRISQPLTAHETSVEQLGQLIGGIGLEYVHPTEKNDHAQS